ncbi:MAG: prolipoprotein diacylglyceryl transferase family protein [Sandaracinus sp.]
MSAAYAFCVALGVFAAALLARALPKDDGIPPEVARTVRIAALGGGVLGAYLFEAPADLFGLAPPTPDGLARLGGRTVLGGLLGGTLAVEIAKKVVGFRAPTGDRFAAPLAVALTFGRLGCVIAGCCPGVVIDARSPFALLSLALHGEPRFPASWVEACFHGLSAIALVIGAKRGWLRRRHFAAYLASYGVVRFLLELVRDVPRPFAGLSYYQLLALVVVALGAWLLVRRVDDVSVAAPLRS